MAKTAARPPETPAGPPASLTIVQRRQRPGLGQGKDQFPEPVGVAEGQRALAGLLAQAKELLAFLRRVDMELHLRTIKRMGGS